MNSKKQTVSAIFLISVVFLSVGCSSTDPWGVMGNVPDGPSQQFHPETDILEPDRLLDNTVSKEQIGEEQLTLEQCISFALENNPRTRESWYAARAASKFLGAGKASCLPEAEFFSGAARADSADARAGSGIREAGPNTTYDAGFGASYLLYDGGRRSAGIDEAEARALIANFRHNTTVQDLVLEVQESYYRLLAAKWSEDVAKETLHQRNSHLEAARQRKQAGVVSRSDVLKARTEVENARLSLVRTRSEIDIASGELATAMNLPVSKPLEVKKGPEEIQKRNLTTVDDLLQKAAKNRPALQSALAQVRRAQANVDAARADYYPDLTVSADYGWREDTFPPAEEEWSTRLGLKFPIFTGFERSYRFKMAENELEQSRANYEDALSSVALEVWSAHSNVKEADQAIEAAQSLVDSAEESLNVAEEEYKTGVGSIIELTDAQTGLCCKKSTA